MDELLDMIVSDESPAQISDKLKDILYAKSAEKVETARPIVANSLFGNQEVEDEIDDDEVEAESEIEVEAEAETEIEDDAQQSTAQVY
jgi:hypothetical protein|tara:strand:- start:663 stop:926 length:264 start_codon:yes stop_codon:yes gene_type:complete